MIKLLQNCPLFSANTSLKHHCIGVTILSALITFTTIISFMSMAAPSFPDDSDRLTESILPRRCYLCGYNFSAVAHQLFPDIVCNANLQHPDAHNPEDILVHGLYGQCNKNHLAAFPGTVVVVNGESHIPKATVSSSPTQRTLYLGPTQHHGKCFEGAFRFQFYHVTNAALKMAQQDGVSVKEIISSPRHNDGTTSVFYQNSHCVPVRENAFSKIAQNLTNGILSASEDSWPVAGGRCIGNPPRPDLADKQDGKWLQYDVPHQNKFMFAMENKVAHGYITEKLLRAFRAGSVPIYWGTPEVFDLFNRRAFLWYEPGSKDHGETQLLQEINRLLSDPQAYQLMLSEPILTPNAATQYFFEGTDLRERILTVMKQQVPLCQPLTTM